MNRENVVILGASDNPHRYSHMALVQLSEQGHNPILVNPRLKSIDGLPCVAQLKDIESNVDTLTVYINPQISDSLATDIINLKARRVIFNPGSENESLYEPLRKKGIEVVEACTLVMLRTNQF